jgi:hypothetical protein
MKKVLMVLMVVIGLALVGTAFAQQLDPTEPQQQAMIAKAKSFKGECVVKAISTELKAATCESVGGKNAGKSAFLRFDYAKSGDEYVGVKGLAVGDKLKGEGKIIGGVNWVTSFEKVTK